jgi:hypothetical protein
LLRDQTHSTPLASLRFLHFARAFERTIQTIEGGAVSWGRYAQPFSACRKPSHKYALLRERGECKSRVRVPYQPEER